MNFGSCICHFLNKAYTYIYFNSLDVYRDKLPKLSHVLANCFTISKSETGSLHWKCVTNMYWLPIIQKIAGNEIINDTK